MTRTGTSLQKAALAVIGVGNGWTCQGPNHFTRLTCATRAPLIRGMHLDEGIIIPHGELELQVLKSNVSGEVSDPRTYRRVLRVI